MRPIFYKLLIFAVAIAGFQACTTTETVIEESYSDGTPMKVVIYEINGDKKEMIQAEYYYSDGHNEHIEYYEGGKKNGKWEYWNENGGYSKVSFYENDELTEEEIYFANGKLSYKSYYRNKFRTGTWVFYETDGKQGADPGLFTGPGVSAL